MNKHKQLAKSLVLILFNLRSLPFPYMQHVKPWINLISALGLNPGVRIYEDPRLREVDTG